MEADPELRDAALGLELEISARICDEVVEEEWGRAFRSPSLPLVWDVNFVLLRERGLSPGAVQDRVGEALAGTGCAKLTVRVEDEAEGQRLTRLCQGKAGWEVERVGCMVRREETERRPAAAVEELPLAAVAGLRRELMAATMDSSSAEEIEQLLERDRRVGAAAGDRWFVAPAAAPRAACRLEGLGGLTQIEDVATMPAARNRGLAQSVVLTALAAALATDPAEVFIAVDASDTPQRLYEKLGFRTVGESTTLRRLP